MVRVGPCSWFHSWRIGCWIIDGCVSHAFLHGIIVVVGRNDVYARLRYFCVMSSSQLALEDFRGVDYNIGFVIVIFVFDLRWKAMECEPSLA